jgi:hypothetical protein
MNPLQKRNIDRAQVLKDFSAALAQHGSAELVLAILNEDELSKGRQWDNTTIIVVTNGIDTMVVFDNPTVTDPGYAAVTDHPGDGTGFIIPAAELRALYGQPMARAKTVQVSGQLMNTYAAR